MRQHLEEKKMSGHMKKGPYGFSVCGSSNAHAQSPIHYENTPIQIHRKFYLQKPENFQIKISDIFHISAQNIDCGYSLEPPRRGGSNEYPQSMF